MLISHKISRKSWKSAHNFVQRKIPYILCKELVRSEIICRRSSNRRKKLPKSKKSNNFRPSRPENVISSVSVLFLTLFHILVGSSHLKSVLIDLEKIRFFSLFRFFQNFLGKRSKFIYFCWFSHLTDHAE